MDNGTPHDSYSTYRLPVCGANPPLAQSTTIRTSRSINGRRWHSTLVYHIRSSAAKHGDVSHSDTGDKAALCNVGELGDVHFCRGLLHVG